MYMDKKYSSKLTKKQETFSRLYLESGNASEAYRQVYSTENMKTKTVWEKACRLRNQDKVRTRIKELTTIELTKSGYDKNDIIETLLDRAFFNVAHVIGKNGKLTDLNPEIANCVDAIEVRKRKKAIKLENGEMVDEEIVSYDFSSKGKALFRLCEYLRI